MIARVMILLAALIGGTTFSQLPEFAQQYRQRLGGAIDELNRIVQRFQEDARREGLTSEQALERLRVNGDRLVQSQSSAMAATMERRERLMAQKAAFESAGPFNRLFAFVRHYDPTLVSGAFKDFEPAIPVTLEGAVLAGFGFLAGLAFAEAMRRLWRRWREGRNRAAPVPVRARRF